MSYGIAYTVYVTGKVFATGLVSRITYYITVHGPRLRWTTTYGEITLRESEFNHHYTIPWRDPTNPMFYWNTLCANAIELFGLSGDRYITDISKHSMTWSFRKEQDALLFRLKFSEVAS